MLWRSFRPLLCKASLPRMCFYDLRHSVASLLLSLGVHPKIVQELLGYSQISLTLDTYSHLLPCRKRQLDGSIPYSRGKAKPVAIRVAVKAERQADKEDR
ncbi:hypothetical protein EPA93_33480 [Ktedonosporobacter rubrisoli]|uniref:Tyr recombinase domain-containing protein n=1 Tax=Ktedonosporobacter rubrisoli TaxID=2509675 RepID=A0A4P6JYR0_KTERU|nr:tyrosine-type recombinase/integrase [Ktedonosporobacter rubrisoli]QBD80623.1 hypothetical protein EPA93_33480 [Ktedonosporobacter rubrisoli]